MSSLSLRNKFILYFSPLLICIILFGLYFVYNLSTIHQQLSRLHRDVTPNTTAMLELKDLLTALETGIKERRIDQGQIAAQMEELKRIVAAHKDLPSTSDSIKNSSHDTLHKAIRTMGLSSYIIKQSATGWQDADLAEVAKIIHQELNDLGPLLDEHLKIHLQELERAEAYVTQKYQTSLIVVGCAIVLMMVLAIRILMSMMHSILKPVNALKEGAKQIGEGNLQYELVVDTGDELEYLATEFREMAAKLHVSHTQLDQKVQERTVELSQAIDDLHREIAERKSAQDEQRRAEEQVHSLSQELFKVQERERQQIALDLHDNVAQELSALKVAGESIWNSSDFGDTILQQRVHEWRKLLDRCVRTVRELSYNLRPPGLEQLGLVSVISDYCRSFAKKSGLAIRFTSAGVDGLPLDYTYAITIYRLIQEALNNIHTHAAAQRVDVKLIASHPNIIVRIEDDGQGFDLEAGFQKILQQKRLGVLGMQERVRMLGGIFRIQSQPALGTKIYIEIPWSTADDSV